MAKQQTRKPTRVCAPEIIRDMTVGDADLLRKQIDALWRAPDENGDRWPADAATDLLAGVAVEAIAQTIEQEIGSDQARFEVDRTAPEMILRPRIMSQRAATLWRVLTIYNAGLRLRTCAECGALFAPPDRREALYCSQACRNNASVKAYRARQKQAEADHGEH